MGKYIIYAQYKKGQCFGRVKSWDGVPGSKSGILGDFTVTRKKGDTIVEGYISVLKDALLVIRKDQIDREQNNLPRISGLEIVSPVSYYEKMLTGDKFFTDSSLLDIRNLLSYELSLDLSRIVFSEGTIDALPIVKDDEDEEMFDPSSLLKLL